MEYKTLYNGVKIPKVGLGVFQVTDLKECEETVTAAFEAGYRHIDTAEAYFNEVGVGNAIKNSKIARKELFITSKAFINSMGYDNTMRAFESSLKKLGLDYLDLYLVHQPYGDTYGAWRAMTKLYNEGAIKAIGVSNFHSDRLVDFCLNNEVTPMINQVEIHAFYQNRNELEYMKKYNVSAEAWAPFARGRNGAFENPVLQEIANAHSKTIPQVMLRFLIEQDIIVLPKSVHADRIKENIDIFDFSLSQEEMEKIYALDENKTFFNDHRNPDFCERIINGSKNN